MFVAGLAVGYRQQRQMDKKRAEFEAQGMQVTDKTDWSGMRVIEAKPGMQRARPVVHNETSPGGLSSLRRDGRPVEVATETGPWGPVAVE